MYKGMCVFILNTESPFCFHQFILNGPSLWHDFFKLQIDFVYLF